MDLKEPQDIIGSRLREIRNESGMTTGNVIKRYVDEEMLKGVERFEIK